MQFLLFLWVLSSAANGQLYGQNIHEQQQYDSTGNNKQEEK
jgi:hypothetical protein